MLWTPDVCEVPLNEACQFEFVGGWDEINGPEKILRKCRNHASIPDSELFKQCLLECREKEFVRLLLHEKMIEENNAYLESKPSFERGRAEGDIRALADGNYYWHFNGDRELEVEVSLPENIRSFVRSEHRNNRANRWPAGWASTPPKVKTRIE